MVRASKTRVSISIQLAWFGILVLLASPVLVLISHLVLQEVPWSLRDFDQAEFLWALKNSFLLGSFSALFSLVAGFGLSFGVHFVDLRYPRTAALVRQALLFPIYLPPFFVILGFFYWFDFVPLGILSSTLAQVMTYAGLVAVLLSKIISETLSDLSEVAQVQGVSRLRFFWMTRLMTARPIGALLLFVFAISFSSFSIPLVLSGGRGTTLEILIYEKIKISQDFGTALVFSLVQSVFLGFLFWILGSGLSTSGFRLQKSKMFSSVLGLVFLVFFLGFQFFPWFGQSPEEWRAAWRQLAEAPGFWNEIYRSGILSLKLALLSMLLVSLLSAAISFLMTCSQVPGFIRSYFPLSVSLLGLSGLLLSSWIGNELAYLFSFALMVLPSLLRLNLESKMWELKDQIQVGRVLGASDFQIYFRLVLPQIRQELSLIAGMTFLWTLGDFAVARFFLPSSSTVTLLIESLMTSYRIQGAILLGLGVLFLGGIVQLILWKVFRVPGSQSS